MMTIQIDSREHKSELTRIKNQFDLLSVKYFISKLYVGDYINIDNPRIAVDRKQNLTELCSNVCQDHERFRNEIIRANENGIKIIFLCEHGEGIECLEDVLFWKNPRRIKRRKVCGVWRTIETNATTGRTLYNILSTIKNKYGVEFLFCEKSETGKRIVEILGGNYES